MIVIQPSTGFGTGHHASTRLCLALMQRLDLRGMTVLDVGTGSGVLAIAAARLGASRVVAVDTDADAVDSARRNVKLNDVDGIELRVADVRTLDVPPVDLVLANLTGAFLAAHAATLASMTRAGGRLIASGFTINEEADVRAAFGGTAAVVSADADGEWAALLLARH